MVVNLYPFYDKVTSTGGIEFEDGIENIDIGGPAMIRAAAKVWFECLLICYWYYQTQHLLVRLQICNMSGLSKLAMFCSLIIHCWPLCHDQKNNKELEKTWCVSGPIIYGRFLIDMTIKLLMVVHQGSGWKPLSCNSKFGSVSEDIEAFYECLLLCCLLLAGWARQKFWRLVGPVTYPKVICCQSMYSALK